MADVTFVVHKDWLDSIQGLPLEQQDKIIADIVRYGCETKMEYDKVPVIAAMVNLLKNRIDYSKEQYNHKIEKAKKAGRKKIIDNDEILRLAREGYSAQEIAEKMGCTKTSIYHSEGWKNRNKILL